MTGTGERIDIFYERTLVAAITAEPELVLRYAPEWATHRAAFPISLSMPLGEGVSYASGQILPWLANLLPESHLSEIGQQLRVSPQDVIGILKQIGRDTAGALSIGSRREPEGDWRRVETEYDLERIIDELPAKPFLVGEQGVSMSLAGVQEKLPVVWVDGEFFIPLDGAPSTHILKPDNRHLPASVQNEAFCLTLARMCGLNVPEVRTGKAHKRQYLLVERYDRFRTDRGYRRIHQEDFCQILGRFPSEKYERGSFGGPTGPTLREMFDAVQRLSTPGQRLELLDGVIFNILTCNTDSHAKNYSMIIGAGGSSKMAPLYDILCAKAYPRVDQALPQSMNGKRNGDELWRHDWELLARQVGLSPAATVDRVLGLAAAVVENAAAAKAAVTAMPAGGHSLLGVIAKQVSKRAERISRQAAVPKPSPRAAVRSAARSHGSDGPEEEPSPRPKP